MTTLVMNYTINPFWTTLKSFARGIWNLLESMGRARAAAELARLGYYAEAKSLMLREYG
jgi:hypothetical protein